jgi:hypothetical protein
MAIDIGRIGFEAYAKQVGGKTYDGKDIPKWEDVGKVVQDGWRAAGVAVLQYIDKERERMANGDDSEG